MTHRVLVVATAPDPSDELLERLRHDAGDDLEVAVVAPESDIPVLYWLAGEEDRASMEARRRALAAAAAEAEAVGAKVVDLHVGDPDPVTAVEDALQVFPADELVVVTRPKKAATWLEKAIFNGELERFGLPVTHLVDHDVAAAVPASAALSVGGPTYATDFVFKRFLITLAVVAGLLILLAETIYLIVR
jgi:nucleotide-binding universal stress UspA family protein